MMCRTIFTFNCDAKPRIFSVYCYTELSPRVYMNKLPIDFKPSSKYDYWILGTELKLFIVST